MGQTGNTEYREPDIGSVWDRKVFPVSGAFHRTLTVAKMVEEEYYGRVIVVQTGENIPCHFGMTTLDLIVNIYGKSFIQT